MKRNFNYILKRETEFKKITKLFKNEKISELVVAHKINKQLFKKLKRKSEAYLKISKKYNLQNMTPNGKLVPKIENESDYNDIIMIFRDIIYSLNIESKIKKWVLPALRYKEEKINKLNKNRASRSELGHSDAWAGWGENAILIQIPILGDTINNRVNYFSMPDDFDKSWMKKKSFEKAQTFARKCKPIKHHYKAGYIYIADISVIHSTYRNNKAKPRMSIDIPLITKTNSKYDKKFDNDIVSSRIIKQLGSNFKVECLSQMNQIKNKLFIVKKY